MGREQFSDNFVQHLANYVGETVTIFTTSGGESGFGCTGVILYVTNCYVRLITSIGPAPGCALGNSCSGSRGNNNIGSNTNTGCNSIRSVGSVTDIPIDRIASFVHNAV